MGSLGGAEISDSETWLASTVALLFCQDARIPVHIFVDSVIWRSTREDILLYLRTSTRTCLELSTGERGNPCKGIADEQRRIADGGRKPTLVNSSSQVEILAKWSLWRRGKVQLDIDPSLNAKLCPSYPSPHISWRYYAFAYLEYCNQVSQVNLEPEAGKGEHFANSTSGRSFTFIDFLTDCAPGSGYEPASDYRNWVDK